MKLTSRECEYFVNMAVCVYFFRLLAPKILSPYTVNVREIKRFVAPTLRELEARNKIYRQKTDPKVLLERDRRSNFVEWNFTSEVYAFGKRLQEEFNLDLLANAFIHRSYIELAKEKMTDVLDNTDIPNLQDNESLINIGERVISDHVWNYVSYFLPRFPLEGIESIHKFLTSDETLAYISKNLGTTHLIQAADYPAEDVTYSKTFKAIVGALDESQGTERANLFVRDLVVAQLSGKDVNDFFVLDNYMGVLKDILERDGLAPPEPRIICQSGVNTVLANYHIGLYSNKELIGHYSGESIDIAIEMAALDALKRLFHTTDHSAPIRYDKVLSVEGKTYANVPIAEWSLSKFQKTQNRKIS